MFQPKIIRTDGTVEDTTPRNGRDFKLAEMQRIIGGGTIEIATLTQYQPHRLLVIDDEGLLKQLPVNRVASRLFGSLIVGDALYCEDGQIK